MKNTEPAMVCSHRALLAALCVVFASAALASCKSEEAPPPESQGTEPSASQTAPIAEEGVLRAEPVTLHRAPLAVGTQLIRTTTRRTDIVWRDGSAPDKPTLTEVSVISEADTTEVLETDGQTITAARMTWDSRGAVNIRGGEESRTRSVLEGRTLELRREADGELSVKDAHGRAPEDEVDLEATLAAERLGSPEDPLGAVLVATPLEPGMRLPVPPQAIAEYVGSEPNMRGEAFEFVYLGLRRDQGVDVAVFDAEQTWVFEDQENARRERTQLQGEWRVHRSTGWTVSVELQGPLDASRGPEGALTGKGTTKLSWTMQVGP